MCIYFNKVFLLFVLTYFYFSFRYECSRFFILDLVVGRGVGLGNVNSKREVQGETMKRLSAAKVTRAINAMRFRYAGGMQELVRRLIKGEGTIDPEIGCAMPSDLPQGHELMMAFQYNSLLFLKEGQNWIRPEVLPIITRQPNFGIKIIPERFVGQIEQSSAQAG